MRYQAVFFDFDYTLGDATESIYEGFVYAMGKMGYPKPELEAVRATVGYMLEDAFSLLSAEEAPEQRAEFRRWFQEKVEGTQAEKTRLFPGAEELLNALGARGVKVGVVTSKRTSTLQEILSRYHLMERMDYIVGGDRVKRPKPDPEGLNTGMVGLGLHPSQVLYCGDTVIDAGTARNAGVEFAAVLNGTTGAEAFEAFPHVHIAPDLMELKNWLEL